MARRQCRFQGFKVFSFGARDRYAGPPTEDRRSYMEQSLVMGRPRLAESRN